MIYQQVSFTTADPSQQEIVIAMLENIGFEGFEEMEGQLVAFIRQENYQQQDVNSIATQLDLKFTEETINPQNWNAIWESGFEPVTVPGFCTIRASFHKMDVPTPHEIIITPKMSFGTGHHATTQLMLEGMREIDFQGLSVLDFGTGTGILAILAKKLGAKTVTAIDNDEWSIANAAENATMNHCEIILAKASLEDIAAAQYDVVLANINRNILMEHMKAMGKQLVNGGLLLLSGIFEEDEPMLTEAAIAAELSQQFAKSKNGWMAIQFLKSS